MITNYFVRCKSIKHKTAKFFSRWGSGWGKTRTKPKQYQHTSFINEHLVRTELDDEVRLLFSISESKNMTSYSWIIKRILFLPYISRRGYRARASTVHEYSVSQSCPILCNPMVCSPPGSSVHDILQAKILEQIAISYSRGSSQPSD